MSLKDHFIGKVLWNVLALLIATSLFALGDYFLSSANLEKLVNISSYVLIALTIPMFGYLLWQRWQTHTQKLHAAKWKQRISAIADSTDEPWEDYTFDDFCELMDDSELERTIEFLEQMPKGQRRVSTAYAEVLKKYGGPL